MSILSSIISTFYEANKVALKDESQSITYSDLPSKVIEISQQLNNVTVLGIALDNSVDWVLWDLAAQHKNIICVPLPPFFSAQQIAHAIESAGISHIIYPEKLIATQFSGIQNIPPKTSKVTYTSGTTGTPKGACLSAESMIQVASSISNLLGKDFAGNHLCILPLAVLLENIAGVYAGLLAGCTIQLCALSTLDKNYEHLYELLKKFGTTSIIVVPEILRILIGQVAEKGPLPRLQFVAVGGSKIHPELLSQAQKIGLPVYEGYGLSECASVVSINSPASEKKGSVGRLLPHVKIDIIDDEVVILQSNFLGYVNSKAPNNVYTSGFYTGDLGYVDSENYLYITGRKKNVLITSFGRNISPEWIESMLLLHPQIAQVVIAGDGEAHVSAIIVPASPSANIDQAVFIVNQQLPQYARIHDVKIAAPFTLDNHMLTGTGRPKRGIISEYYL